MRKAALDLIESVKKDGISADIAAKVREQQTRDRETALRENGFWLAGLVDSARFGDDPKQIVHYDDLVKLVTSDALRDTARTVFNTQRAVTGVLYPETPPPAAK